MNQDEILLSIRGLSVSFFTEACRDEPLARRGGVMPAVQDVGFSIKKGRTFALVGESGCGKTTVALSILRLLARPKVNPATNRGANRLAPKFIWALMGRSRKAGAAVEHLNSGTGENAKLPSPVQLLNFSNLLVSGEIVFEGQNLLSLSEKQMRRIRGGKIAMIFQEPMTSLNPVYRVGDQIVEAIKRNRRLTQMHAEKRNIGVYLRSSAVSHYWTDAVEMLRKVGIADPEQRVRQYPHQMSGGMQQRVMIAMAASCQPKLLIADEPTTALDVTTQAQILDLLDQLQQAGMSILLITHDLGIVAERADDVAVMYASRIVEMAPKGQLFKEPYHPYTQGLLQSLPRLGVSTKRLQTIPGTVPEPLHFPTGCKFHPRCRIGSNDTRCQTVEPELREVQPQRQVACWYAAKS